MGSETTAKNTTNRWFILAVLILCGETIFALPYHIPRFFRPTFLDTFGLTNGELGDVFACFGVVALLAYLPGGLLADRFSARALIVWALLLTALGGFYLTLIPSLTGLKMLYAYWGVTSILLLWAALIRATRDWGADRLQGRAFGLLDAGRGLAAAVAASAAVALFGWLLAQNKSAATALQWVIGYYSVLTFLLAVTVWKILPTGPGHHREHSLIDARIIAHPGLLLAAVVVVCAYCGYKGLDNYGLYAVRQLGLSDLQAAQFTANAAYLRAIAPLLAGLLADKIGASKSIALCFCASIVSATAMIGLDAQVTHWLIYANLVLSYFAVYALRGVYFALIAEVKIPTAHTGLAAGLISLIGFTPDIFFAAITGRILDGENGFAHYFIILAAIAVVGLLTALILVYRHSRARATAS